MDVKIEDCEVCDGTGQMVSGKQPMTFEQYNEEILKTAKYSSMGCNILYPLTGLLEEAGEVAGVIKKAQRTMNEGYEGETSFATHIGGYSKIVKNDSGNKVKEKLLDECGDVLWYLNRVVVEAGSSLEEVAKRNIQKTQKRLKDGTLLATEKRPEEESERCNSCGGLNCIC